jgi:hypothetical protein
MADWGVKFSHFEKIQEIFRGLTLDELAKYNNGGAATGTAQIAAWSGSIKVHVDPP